jgi:hypothetical protein
MAPKRARLAIPEQEKKGQQAILRSADEVAAEEKALLSQEAEAVAPDRTTYPKATYRMSPEAVEAIEDAKRTLRRTYKLKVSLEEIAEAALIAVYADLMDNKDSSMLVSQFSGKPARQVPG